MLMCSSIARRFNSAHLHSTRLPLRQTSLVASHHEQKQKNSHHGSFFVLLTISAGINMPGLSSCKPTSVTRYLPNENMPSPLVRLCGGQNHIGLDVLLLNSTEGFSHSGTINTSISSPRRCRPLSS